MALKILKASDAFFSFQFEDIVESHARTVDITTHNYYDMLYAFHVFRGNFRKGKKTLKCLNTSRIDGFFKEIHHTRVVQSRMCFHYKRANLTQVGIGMPIIRKGNTSKKQESVICITSTVQIPRNYRSLKYKSKKFVNPNFVEFNSFLLRYFNKTLKCFPYSSLLITATLHLFWFVAAGSAMYEHAMRLGQEVSGLDSLQKQVLVKLTIIQ